MSPVSPATPQKTTLTERLSVSSILFPAREHQWVSGVQYLLLLSSNNARRSTTVCNKTKIYMPMGHKERRANDEHVQLDLVFMETIVFYQPKSS